MVIDSVILVVIILVVSVVIHEVAHGYAALWLGDSTAHYAGRLTLNPIKHIDPLGSIILPLIFALMPGGLIFGWAKPVPYNPYNLKNRRWGELLVAIAGALSYILLAFFFGLYIQFFDPTATMAQIALTIVSINVVLAVFNMVPIPPLDGSKVLFALFPKQAEKLRAVLEQWGFIALIIFIFLFSSILHPIMLFLINVFTGNF